MNLNSEFPSEDKSAIDQEIEQELSFKKHKDNERKDKVIALSAIILSGCLASVYKDRCSKPQLDIFIADSIECANKIYDRLNP